MEGGGGLNLLCTAYSQLGFLDDTTWYGLIEQIIYYISGMFLHCFGITTSCDSPRTCEWITTCQVTSGSILSNLLKQSCDPQILYKVSLHMVMRQTFSYNIMHHEGSPITFTTFRLRTVRVKMKGQNGRSR